MRARSYVRIHKNRNKMITSGTNGKKTIINKDMKIDKVLEKTDK